MCLTSPAYSFLYVGVNAWVVYVEPLTCVVLVVESDCVCFFFCEGIAEEDSDGVVGYVREGAVWPEFFDDAGFCKFFGAEGDAEFFFHFASGGFGECLTFLNAATWCEVDTL